MSSAAGQRKSSQGLREGQRTRSISEYKEIALTLVAQGVLSKAERNLLEKMAGYRNRMVHYYQEIMDRELYEICTAQTEDVRTLLEALLRWIVQHPQQVDHSL